MTTKLNDLISIADTKAAEISKINSALMEASQTNAPAAEATLNALLVRRANIRADIVLGAIAPTAESAINDEIEIAESTLHAAKRSDFESSSLVEALSKRLEAASGEHKAIQLDVLGERKALLSAEVESGEAKIVEAAKSMIEAVMQLEQIIYTGNTNDLFAQLRWPEALPERFYVPLVSQPIEVDYQYRSDVHAKTSQKLSELLHLPTKNAGY